MYDFLRNEAFDANDWFSNNAGFPRGKLRQNDFGATFGGPVVLPHLYDGHNKTFVFASFEGLQLVTPMSEVVKVPDQGLKATAAPALQPLLSYFPTANGADLGDACPNQPDPTYLCGAANYTVHASQPSNVYTGAIRIDHAITPKMQSFVRYTRSPSLTSPIDLYYLGNDYTSVTNQSLTSGVTWIPTPHFGNDLRFNWSTTNSRTGTVPVPNGLNLFSYLQRSQSDPANSFSVFQIDLSSGHFALEQGSSYNHTQQFNAVDTLSWTKGPHLFKFGGNLRRLNATLTGYQYEANTIFESVDSVQAGVADYLLTASSNQPEPVFWDYGLFVNDDWAVSSRFRVQLGLRWDVNPVPGAVSGQLPVVFRVSPDFTVTPEPAGTPIYSTRYTNFAPRVGLAYAAHSGRHGLVLRAGGGLYYDTSDANGATPYGSYPFGGSSELDNVSFPFTAAQTASPPLVVPVALPYGTIYATDPHLRSPLTYSWSAAVEQSLGDKSSFTMTYVGNRGSLLLQTVENFAQYPAIEGISYTTNGADSSYHALQLQYQARLLKGITAFAGYTWSHSIDDVGLQQYGSYEVPIRGNSDGDQRHNFHLGLSYTVPPVHRRVLSLMGGLGTDMNVNVQSGLPFDLSSGYIAGPNIAQQTARPDVVLGQPFWITNALAPGGWQLNPNAFTDPPTDANGNFLPGDLGRNVFHGFTTGQADFDVRKTFALTERLGLLFRAEAFNITNHPNFSNYDTYASDATVGQPQATLGQNLGGLSPLYQVGGPRSLQLALKVLF